MAQPEDVVSHAAIVYETRGQEQGLHHDTFFLVFCFDRGLEGTGLGTRVVISGCCGYLEARAAAGQLQDPRKNLFSRLSGPRISDSPSGFQAAQFVN